MKKEATTEINFSDHESTFSLSFSYFCRLFSAKANFFQICFCCSNFSFFSSRGNKQILVSLGRVQYCFFVPQVELCCPLGQFLSFGLALRTKIIPRDNKAQPSGHKTILYPPSGHQNLFVSSRKKKKKLSSKKNLRKKIGLGKKSL